MIGIGKLHVESVRGAVNSDPERLVYEATFVHHVCDREPFAVSDAGHRHHALRQGAARLLLHRTSPVRGYVLFVMADRVADPQPK
ncbi:MAG: hypothetical protein ACE5HT_08895 [Gemmatimonadales bacterium]